MWIFQDSESHPISPGVSSRGFPGISPRAPCGFFHGISTWIYPEISIRVSLSTYRRYCREGSPGREGFGIPIEDFPRFLPVILLGFPSEIFPWFLPEMLQESFLEFVLELLQGLSIFPKGSCGISFDVTSEISHGASPGISLKKFWVFPTLFPKIIFS